MVRQRTSAFPSKGRSTQMIPKPTMLMKRWQAGFDRHRHHQLADGSRIDIGYGLSQQPDPSSFHQAARSKVASSYESRIAPSSGATRGNANFFEASLSAHLAQPRPGFHPIKRSSRSSHQGFSSLPPDCEAKAEEAAARLTGRLPWLEEEPLPLLSSQRNQYAHRDEDTIVAHRQPPLRRRSSPGALPLADAFSDDENMYGGATPRHRTPALQHHRGSMMDPGLQHSQLGLDDDEDLNLHSHPGVFPEGVRGQGRGHSDFNSSPRGHHTSRSWRHSFAETLGRPTTNTSKVNNGRESNLQPEVWPTQQHEAFGRRFDESMADSRQRLRFHDDDAYYGQRSMIATRSSARGFHDVQTQNFRQMRSASPPRVARVPRRLAVAPSGGIHQCIAENDPSNWSSEDDMPRQRKRIRCEAEYQERAAMRSRRFSPSQRNQEWQQGCIFDDNPFKRMSNVPNCHARHQGVCTPSVTHKPQSLLALGLSPAWEER